jgi:hypothetical protein
MHRISRLAVLALVAALLLLALAAPAFAGGRALYADLTGAAEVPGPGDPDGSGSATITFSQGKREICWEIQVTNITLPASAAHIHAAVAGVAGPVVVTLSPPDATGVASGCTTVEKDLLKAIRKNPENYYVNVHNTDFPAGAVRGQLYR